MNRFQQLLRSSIGSKFFMAVTGLVMLGFVLGHLTGNLLIYQGPKAVNDYAHWLHSHTGMLWAVRVVLLGTLALHIATGIRLWLSNKAARPQPYAREATVVATWASRQMVLTGVLLLVYVVYHLLHLTFHTIDTGAMQPGPDGQLDVYAMLVSGFRHPLVALSYVVAQLVLGLHLIHGVGSMFQTFGWTHPLFRPVGVFLGWVLPIAIVIGYVSIPVSVLLGFVK